MTNKKIISKLEEILCPDFENVLDSSIIPVRDGYDVFNRYSLYPKKNSVLVKSNKWCENKTFASKRTALSWCIADKYQKRTLAWEIEYLDRQKERLRNDVNAQLQNIDNFRDPVRRDIVELKLETKKSALRHVSEQLNKCINLAKYWQIKGFDDEIARTRKNYSNRTSC